MLARPIRFTSHLTAFQYLLTALGGTTIVEDDGWVVIALDSGRLALHVAGDEKPSGFTTLGFEVVDLDAFAATATAAGVDVRLQQQGEDRYAVVRADEGLVFTVEDGLDVTVEDGFDVTVEDGLDGDIENRAEAASGETGVGLSIMPLWYSTDVDGARAMIRGIGAHPRMRSDSGVWTDFACDTGGLVAVHADVTTSTALSFEYDGDLDALADRLRSRGIDARIIDENYSRVLLVPDPDGGADLWINLRQRDLYGFTVAAALPE